MCGILLVYGFEYLDNANRIMEQFFVLYKQTLSPKRLATHPDEKARVMQKCK